MTGILTPDERAVAMARFFDLLDQAMDIVRFTGQVESRDGQWVGVYGTSSNPH
jgi:hypothetical protein